MSGNSFSELYWDRAVVTDSQILANILLSDKSNKTEAQWNGFPTKQNYPKSICREDKQVCSLDRRAGMKVWGTLSWRCVGTEDNLAAISASYIGFQVTPVVKNRPANAGDVRDSDSILGLGRLPGGRHANLLQYSCLENTRTEEACGLQSMGSHRAGHDWSKLAQHSTLVSKTGHSSSVRLHSKKEVLSIWTLFSHFN